MKHFSIIFSTVICFTLISCGSGGSKKAANSSIVDLTTQEFTAIIGDYESGIERFKYLGDQPAVVYFYAVWCGPCRTQTPIFKEMAKEYEGRVKFYTVNIDKEKELSQKLGTTNIPALLFIPTQGVLEVTGPMTFGQLNRNIEKQFFGIE